jgi:U3 small nucleolar RNA-associated protein MPP10
MGPDGAVKAELTPAERKAARQRTRRQRSAREKQLDTLSNGALVVGGGRARKAKGIKGDKVEKQAAVDALVGKRGVTVIGKPSAKVKAVKGKAVARAEVRMASHGSAALKL